MIRSILSISLAIGLFSGGAEIPTGQQNATKAALTAVKPAAANDLSTRLPDSDTIIFINVQKVLQDFLPHLLSSRPAKMDEINAQIDQLKQRTGIDVRAFQDVAIGARYVPSQAKQSSLKTVVLARGDFKAPALVAAARIAANGKTHDVKSGGKTITVISIADLKDKITEAAGSAPTNGPDKGNVAKILNQVLGQQSGDLAVCALDQDVLAFGDLAMVQDAVAGKKSSAANYALITLAQRTPDSIIGVGGNVPAGLSKQIGLDNDQITKSLDSIRQAFGAVTYNADSYNLLVGARANSAESAADLKDTVEGLQALGGLFAGQVKNESLRKVAQRGLDNLKVSQTGAEVQMQLAIPQTDAAVLLDLWK